MKPHRFTDDGELLDSGGQSLLDEVTPPDKLEILAQEQSSSEPFPDLQSLLSIPTQFIIALVKNKTEANVLFQIRQISSQLSILIHYLTNELQSGEVS